MNGRTFRAADLIVDALAIHGVDRAFGVPGESFLALLDALHGRDEVDFVTCRHESGASLAAIADAKLVGRAGVAMVSRGPGAFNAGLGCTSPRRRPYRWCFWSARWICRI